MAPQAGLKGCDAKAIPATKAETRAPTYNETNAQPGLKGCDAQAAVAKDVFYHTSRLQILYPNKH